MANKLIIYVLQNKKTRRLIYVIIGFIFFLILLPLIILENIFAGTELGVGEFYIPINSDYQISAPFGVYSPGGVEIEHYGTDFTSEDNTQIFSATNGVVTAQNNNCEPFGGYLGNSCANYVIVQSDDYIIMYYHLSEVDLEIEIGKEITAGDNIGLMGNSGNSTGTHLHLEVQKNGIPINIQPNLKLSPIQRFELFESFKISDEEQGYINYIFENESGWRPYITNLESGAYGLCQSLPAEKMDSAGEDWKNNYRTQFKWCNDYANKRYGSWKNAYEFWQANSWW